MKAKTWVLAEHFEGEPQEKNLQLVEEDLPEIKDGEILIEAEFLSVDPYMRPYAHRFPAGTTMFGQQVAKVLESRHAGYPVGCSVLAYTGWRTHSVFNPDAPAFFKTSIVPDLGSLPKSLALGALGMPGCTAYFGVEEVLKPKEGQTLLVSTAAGAVGSVVGQMAKIKGLRVIGSTGSDSKCKWLKEELGFDYVFNYKTTDVDTALNEGAPKGIDCYYDNVGGDFTQKVVQNHMNSLGRVAICGTIGCYNSSEADMPTGLYPWTDILMKQIMIEGIIVSRWEDKMPDAVKQLAEWVKQGKLKYREHVTEGFENMRSAMYGMLKGENTGKAVVKV